MYCICTHMHTHLGARFPFFPGIVRCSLNWNWPNVSRCFGCWKQRTTDYSLSPPSIFATIDGRIAARTKIESYSDKSGRGSIRRMKCFCRCMCLGYPSVSRNSPPRQNFRKAETDPDPGAALGRENVNRAQSPGHPPFHHNPWGC